MPASPPPPGLANIKRVVVMMFENRSFDHIFGALPGVNGLLENGQINQSYFNLPDPLSPPSETNLPVYPTPIDPALPQAHDFTHDFGDGMMPDLFGPTFTVTPKGSPPDDSQATYTSGYANGVPTGQIQPPPTTYPATNSGFYTTFNTCEQQGQAALTYFEAGALQVLHPLAQNFVLCDNWHCDMPGHTLPNRGFIHCATTGIVGIDDTDGGQITDAQTIFQVIDQLPKGGQPSGWKMYTPVAEVNGQTELGQLDTNWLNYNVSGYQGAPITEFVTDCNADQLPFYSFIMCFMPYHAHTAYTDTSMHPNSMVQGGENLLAAVYNTLLGSPCWKDTLLVVTFDENGGIYDHVFPPTTSRPDPKAPVTTQNTVGSCGNKWWLDSQFDFSLLGLRVPAILISPWLTPGIDNTQYQNTSVTRLLIDTMNSEFNQTFPPLTQRDATAPSLAAAFSQFGLSEMRANCPMMLSYATLPSTDPSTGSNAVPYSGGTLVPWTPPTGTMSAPPVRYIKEVMNIYVAPLPGDSDSGKPITQEFATNADVAAYTERRVKAANQFRAMKGGSGRT
jgi:phospholipase C